MMIFADGSGDDGANLENEEEKDTIPPQTQKKCTLIRRSPGIMTHHLQKVQITGFVTNFSNIVST